MINYSLHLKNCDDNSYYISGKVNKMICAYCSVHIDRQNLEPRTHLFKRDRQYYSLSLVCSFIFRHFGWFIWQCFLCGDITSIQYTKIDFFHLRLLFQMLLWQISVTTDPRIFVIATCFWSELIIYLLVSCNKQLFSSISSARQPFCSYTYRAFFFPSCVSECVQTEEMSCVLRWREKLLITTYQEVNDQLWSKACCDDENVRIGGNTDLPEQHCFINRIEESLKLWAYACRVAPSTEKHYSRIKTYIIRGLCGWIFRLPSESWWK
mgnify:CR=1 FL=1